MACKLTIYFPRSVTQILIIFIVAAPPCHTLLLYSLNSEYTTAIMLSFQICTHSIYIHNFTDTSKLIMLHKQGLYPNLRTV